VKVNFQNVPHVVPLQHKRMLLLRLTSRVRVHIHTHTHHPCTHTHADSLSLVLPPPSLVHTHSARWRLWRTTPSTCTTLCPQRVEQHFTFILPAQIRSVDLNYVAGSVRPMPLSRPNDIHQAFMAPPPSLCASAHSNSVCLFQQWAILGKPSMPFCHEFC
jgi:hypothetical protein